jgi:Na+-driven multidrug efflux pump
VVLGIGLFEARSFAPALLTSVTAVQHETKGLITLLAVLMPVTAISFVIDGLLAGIERFDLLRTIMIFSFAAFVAAAVLLRGFATLIGGVESVWTAFSLWIAVRALISVVLWWRSRSSGTTETVLL